jgi:class I fructose-bisphosphate aldolase/fructose-bisphosphate aldolase/2-amino-3,7-dideoxy-D-threo-hept-6-ulosonate synthase
MHGTGKTLRWSRFLDRQTGRSLIVPLDHGLTNGPIEGLQSLRRVATWIDDPAINGIIAHKGTVERLVHAGALGRSGVMLHLNGMTTLAEHPDTKEMLTTVDAALRLGADAVSVQLNFTHNNAAHNLQALGSVVDAASSWGLPVLAMVYDKLTTAAPAERLKRIRHLIRIAYELGVDAVKIDAPATPGDVSAVLADLADDVAVFFSGGPLRDIDHLLQIGAAAVAHGAVGLCVGRNVFERPDRATVLALLHNSVIAPREYGIGSAEKTPA